MYTTQTNQLLKLAVTSMVMILCTLSVSANEPIENWSTVFESDSIKIEATKGNCVKEVLGNVEYEYQYLKITNLTPLPIQVSYDKVLWYDNHCYNCDANNPEYHFNTTVGPLQTAVGTCASSSNEALVIFSKMLNIENVRQLTDFRLTNIEINTNL